MEGKLSSSEIIQTIILCVITFAVIFYVITETDLDKNDNNKTPLGKRILTAIVPAVLFSVSISYLSRFIDQQYTKKGKLKK